MLVTRVASACPRVALAVNPNQMQGIKLSINLFGGYVRVIQQLLYRPQIFSGFKHVAGKRRPQHMGEELLVISFGHAPAA